MRTWCFGLMMLGACGGPAAPAAPPMDRQMSSLMKSMAMPSDPAASFGPLEVGADYASYVKMNTAPVPSETHGGRLVDTYVNEVGASAYLDDDAVIPVGTVIHAIELRYSAPVEP